MTGIYKIADKNIKIISIYPEIHDLCKDYKVEDISDFTVQTVNSDLKFEQEKSAREDLFAGIPVRKFTDAYLETLAVYRKIAEEMPAYSTVLFHGSAIAVDEAGYIFTAKSGVGKSTHAGLWREMLGERAIMVNDDKPLIRISEKGAEVYGTPWDGKHHLSRNISVCIRAICILERGTENRIKEISVGDALPMLIQQVYRPKDPAMMKQTLSLIDMLSVSVRLYKLKCNINREAAMIAYDTMKG